jgi:hypothetical protein
MKTHVINGCPSLNPDSVTGKAAAETRRAREEAEALKRENDEYHRYVLESRKKEKDATGWLEVYRERAAAAEAEIEHLKRENEKLRASAAASGARGGAGGTNTAGRDATIVGRDMKTVTLNFYGSEQMDPRMFEGLVGQLVKGLERGIAAGHKEEELRATTIAGGVRLLLKEPENQVVKGWEEEKDEVGVHEGEGEWGSKPTEEVASRYGRELRDKMRAAHMSLSFDEMSREELASWGKKEGGDAVRQAALENEATAAAARLEDFKKGKKEDYWE